MLRDIELKFDRGTILTKEMLQEVYDAPRETSSILYDRHPDGILAGLDILERDGRICLTKGLVKHLGRIYRMAEDLDLQCFIEGQHPDPEVDHKLMFTQAEPERIGNRSSQMEHALRFQLVGPEDEEDGIELARFRMTSDNRVQPYHDLDQSEPYRARFWDMTLCPYSTLHGSTFHPYVFRMLKPYLLSSDLSDAPWRFVVADRLAADDVLGMDLLLEILRDHGIDLSPEQRRKILESLCSLQLHKPAARSAAKSASNKPNREPVVGCL